MCIRDRDENVALIHASVDWKRGAFRIKDLQSTTGIWMKLGGGKVRGKKKEIADKTFVRLAGTWIFFIAFIEDNVDDDQDDKCIICFEMPRNILFAPCNHLATCKDCAPKVNKCPVCRQYILDRKSLHFNIGVISSAQRNQHHQNERERERERNVKCFHVLSIYICFYTPFQRSSIANRNMSYRISIYIQHTH
eukprot:TRINITY_DN3258_c0_g1_i1.p1 TRINITY_DN3258_c0_g1~~TRINITY_DN3258_c0_g1_i1.p1  ORF type:complete len:213 (+),score=28.98 TRINITY_DN3258_c0_g1_i1:62-640(+)